MYAAVVDGRVAVKLGPGSWSPTAAGVPIAQGRSEWALTTSGNDFAVRRRCQTNWELWLSYSKLSMLLIATKSTAAG